MTIRDITYHLEATVGSELSHDTISKITDQVLDEMVVWQTLPLEPLYPILYLDAIVVKVRDGHHVKNKAAHIAIGGDHRRSQKGAGGFGLPKRRARNSGPKVCAQLANPNVKDVLIACCDGLTGFPALIETIEATWSQSTVQTCAVHLIRAANRFVSYGDRKAVSAVLRQVYTVPTEETAAEALAEFEASVLGQKYPAAVQTWRNAWDRFIPFLAFSPQLRKVFYTTNAIESLNYQRGQRISSTTFSAPVWSPFGWKKKRTHISQ